MPRTLTVTKPIYDIKITKPSGKVLCRHSNIKRKILNFAKANKNKNDLLNLKVTYKKNFINEGEYTNWREFIKAWQVFTEKDLIEDVCNY
jgi:hypothetical protein